jgi:hypothetical protein
MSPRSLTILAIVISTAGCHFDPDIDWEGGFAYHGSWWDPHEYPVDNNLGARNLQHPVPVGARLDAVLDEHDLGADGVLIASSHDSDIVEVEEQGGEIIGLRALAEGEAEILLDSEYGDNAKLITLRVEAPTHRELVPVREYFLGPTAVLPTQVETTGLALRPGAAVSIGLGMWDAEGQELSGHDFLDWSWDATLLGETSGPDWVNTLHLRAQGPEGISAVTADDLSYELRTLGRDDVPELRLYGVDEGLNPTGTIDSIEGEAGWLTLGLGAFDEDERWVVAAEDELLEITVLEGPADLVRSWDHSLALHGFSLVGCPGEGLVEISYAGASRQMPITLIEGPSTPGSCG